jgi:hypothetical protein
LPEGYVPNDKQRAWDLESLTEVFRAYGADDPGSWAQSQIEEGIPQLALFSFVKSLWAGVVAEDDTSWIDEEIRWSTERPDSPCAPAGIAITEMLARGVSRDTIIDLVRVAQYEVLHHACVIIDGARIEDVPTHNWLLFQTDDDENPTEGLSGVHEILLGLDPTGREMRRRPS